MHSFFLNHAIPAVVILCLLILEVGLGIMHVGLNLEIARYLEHAVAFTGITILTGYGLGFNKASPAKHSMKQMLSALSGLIACTGLALLTDKIGIGSAVFIAGVLILGLIIWSLAREWIPFKVIEHPVYAAVLFSLAISWSWELVQQPIFEVYGAAPRGYVQWWQVLADLIGIAVGALVAGVLLKKSPPLSIDSDN